MSGPTTRHILIELLRTLPDVQEAWDPRSGGGGPRLMPSAYHEGSYAELEQQLATMRDTHRQHWWHLSHRYRWGIVRREHVPCRRTRLGPIPRLRPYTELVSAGPIHGKHMQCTIYEWRNDVLPIYVDAAIDRLLATMHDGQPHRIRLPQPMWERLLGVPPSEQQRRRQDPTSPPTRLRATVVL